MARGRRPNLERRKQAAELRARGLPLVEIGRKLGCTRQAVQQLLRPPGASRALPTLVCAACGAILGSAPGPRARASPLCLPCLARRPRATSGERLRAYRIARGLSRQSLADP